MDLIIVGLGRMGANMARRLHRAGHHVVAFNRTPDKTEEIMGEGLDGALSPETALAKLPTPRVVWLMVPAGDATEQNLEEWAALLRPGDTIVDGGNSDFRDSQRRHRSMAERGIRFVDAGISGGVWGLQNGYGAQASLQNRRLRLPRPIVPSPSVSSWLPEQPRIADHKPRGNPSIKWGQSFAYRPPRFGRRRR